VLDNSSLDRELRMVRDGSRHTFFPSTDATNLDIFDPVLNLVCSNTNWALQDKMPISYQVELELRSLTNFEPAPT
jgi:hypothetical protein